MSAVSLPIKFDRDLAIRQRKRGLLLTTLACVLLCPPLMAADSKTTNSKLTAEQVVDRHVTARGGLQAWRALQTMSVNGKLDAGAGDSAARGARVARGRPGSKVNAASAASANSKQDADKQVQLPFLLDMKRPHKSRLEIEFAGKTAVQVFDGANGWKLRPYLNRTDVEPFTAEEAKAQEGERDMDGPLIDFAAKGSKVELAGVEAVEGKDAYHLKVTGKSGRVRHVWIDTQSFLDVKVEGTPRRMDGRMHTVWVYQRDFRSVKGLMIPFVLETAVDGYPGTHKMVVDKVAVNPTLADARFEKPKV